MRSQYEDNQFNESTDRPPVKDTNRSLLIAALACLAMGLFAKSPQFQGHRSWISGLLALATLGLSAWGFRVGLRAARRYNTAWAWLAPAVNALIVVFFSAFLVFLFQALERLN
jgi:uncharacterized BrkB/YihY/UPF0761 family membrane protein